MIRYHVVEERGSLYLIKQSVSLYYAQSVKRILSSRYPERHFKVLPVDVWNQFLRALERF